MFPVGALNSPTNVPDAALNAPANVVAPVFESKLNVTSPRESVPIIPSSSIVTLSLIAIEPTDISEIFPPIVPLISKLLPSQVRLSAKENVPLSFKKTLPAEIECSSMSQPPISPSSADILPDKSTCCPYKPYPLIMPGDPSILPILTTSSPLLS